MFVCNWLSVELFIYLPISTFQVQNTDFSHSVSWSVSHHVMVIWRMEHLYVPITLLTPKNLQNKKGTSLISSLSIFRLLYIFFLEERHNKWIQRESQTKKVKIIKRTESNTRAQNENHNAEDTKQTTNQRSTDTHEGIESTQRTSVYLGTVRKWRWVLTEEKWLQIILLFRIRRLVYYSGVFYSYTMVTKGDIFSK